MKEKNICSDCGSEIKEGEVHICSNDNKDLVIEEHTFPNEVILDERKTIIVNTVKKNKDGDVEHFLFFYKRKDSYSDKKEDCTDLICKMKFINKESFEFLEKNIKHLKEGLKK